MAMDKPAETSQPIHELLHSRWSPRAFQDKPVPKDVLVSLFEAARWAASCNNSQPWRFISRSRKKKRNSNSCLVASTTEIRAGLIRRRCS